MYVSTRQTRFGSIGCTVSSVGQFGSPWATRGRSMGRLYSYSCLSNFGDSNPHQTRCRYLLTMFPDGAEFQGGCIGNPQVTLRFRLGVLYLSDRSTSNLSLFFHTFSGGTVHVTPQSTLAHGILVTRSVWCLSDTGAFQKPEIKFSSLTPRLYTETFLVKTTAHPLSNPPRCLRSSHSSEPSVGPLFTTTVHRQFQC